MRKDLPIEISNKMKLWRLGLGTLPKSYIEFHKELAEEQLKVLESQGVIIHRTYLDTDGWGDGMRVIYAIIEKNNELMKIIWNDGSQEFFKQSKTGGRFPLRLA